MSQPTLAPTYGADIRLLLNDAFGAGRPIPFTPVPGGSLRARLRAWRMRSDNDRTVSEGESIYWDLALPHFVFPHCTLIYLSRMHDEGGDAAERAVLAALDNVYDGMPLPPRVLTAIGYANAAAPRSGLISWLERARRRVLGVRFEDLAAEWARLRADALTRGMERWTDVTCTVAELSLDVMTLCRGSLEDVRRARSNSRSVRAGLQEADKRADTQFEYVLGRIVLRPELHRILPSTMHARAAAYHAARPRHALEGVLREDWRPQPVRVNATASVEHDRPASAGRGFRQRQADVARHLVVKSGIEVAERYRTLFAGLNERIIGRPDLCRQLAFLGVAHLAGASHQRLLLCGGTGTGKTHAARALAAVLGAPYAQIDANDIVQTGFRGLNIGEALQFVLTQFEGLPDAPPPLLVLDEFDKLRVAADVGGVTAEARWGVQASMLALLDGQTVSVGDGGGANRQVDTSGWLIVGTGAFGGMFTAAAPSTEQLVAYGFMPELAERWSERTCLPPLDFAHACDLLVRSERAAGGAVARMAELAGVEVELTDQAVGYVARQWLARGVGFRAAAAWLNRAARARIIEVLEGQRSAGRIVVSPDDIDCS